MRAICSFLLVAFAAACAAAPARIVATDRDLALDVVEVADELAAADVVVLGELHRTPPVHETHLLLLEELHERRPNLAIAMEMFERDVQTVMLQYLNGLIDEDEFRAKARPWPDYVRDYRPVVEFARRNGLLVLAANAPALTVKRASREGLDAVRGEPHIAREVSAPQDDGYDAFVEMMQGHPGVTDAMMQRFYGAQCLRDDTMAETVTDHLRERRGAGADPLVVLICGRGHSDHRRGAVQRMLSRMPDLDVRVLSAEAVADADVAVYAAPRDVADYVLVVPEQPQDERPLAMPVAKAAGAKGDGGAPGGSGAAEAGEDIGENPPGLRPALGFMPGDYQGEVAGVLVGQVRAGGNAELAGIEEGDVIVALAGKATPDVESYTDVLDGLRIGRTVTVRIRREGAEADLQVKVGSRPDRGR